MYKILRGIFDYNKKKSRVLEIDLELSSPKTWTEQISIKKLNKEKYLLNSIIQNINEIEENIKEVVIFLELAIETQDNLVFKESLLEIQKIEQEIKKLEFYRMFSKKNDHYDCYIDIQSGSGGTDAQDWSKMLLRMYLRWADKKGFHTEIIDESIGEIVGIKSSTIKVSGEYAFGWFRTETGIHRLIRKSPFDSGKRRHTSFSSIFIYPDINEKIDININYSDLRIDVYRASGAGGQHVNRTESAVRITHLPTNIVTQCQNNRSQHKNKEQAMKQMQSKLYEIQMRKKQEEKQKIEQNKSDITWGNQIRSYILDNSKIKDLRTGVEKNHVQSVLDGDLDDFIEQSLIMGL
ncbi:peptide chain release factor 2 [Buchnera aphidicola str. APS (Acyrthosiphon pisum)]|uniref:Peptide chain release factor 2 n=1 Tax=Buchnera aphidicola subsp. Acyrthosiphon pisum (strain 5A) TaxID=563178 RepID=A0A7U3YAG5_BUCA5|nr:peptide chain release factor 2 [imported] - Buchnera sp. (strain APS) [Buchnera sp. (in: enterobacteria)]ACL30785.1 peptide chain release factor 2 [Buchnera aphidicola str. 5A (Acyrthosiphon pisum)]ADP67407.1 peptide chain release factor 2 [Buchnera aphidicola str. JF99 (Acyrthosiphon pisum)]OQX99448.1 MAG: peptide chain release factor 2 [Erwiniaceae bacterium 4572_131]BAB13134.1 peptide chain release factor 2 [Buchnera aphidicola str. APS (Acyrthosiphon pisum)]